MPEYDWGCLWVWGESTTLKKVTAAVCSAYSAVGCSEKGLEEADPLLPPLYLNSATKLAKDDVIVVEDECDWIAVMSLNFEWAPPGAHPLALALAKKFEVLSICSNSVDGYAEYSLYRDGKLAQTLGFGNVTLPDVDPLDLALLAARGGFEAEDLSGVLDQPMELAKFAGCEWQGHRMVFDVMSLEDLGAEHLHIFR